MNGAYKDSKILIITFVRNEEKYLPRMIESMLSQTLRPRCWVIVDDGSTDNTLAIAQSVSEKHPWVIVHKRDQKNVPDFGKGLVEAFYDGLACTRLEEYDFVGTADGDTILGKSYYEILMKKFEEDPILGIASGWIIGVKSKPFYPLAIAKLYRKSCFIEIGGLAETLGWDSIDNYEAMRKGWRAKMFSDEGLAIKHMRPMGTSYKGVLQGRYRHGLHCYCANMCPFYFFGKVLKYFIRYPYIVGAAVMLWGYLKPWFSGLPQYGDVHYKNFVRRFQMKLIMQMLNPFHK